MFFASYEYENEAAARQDLSLLWDRNLGGEMTLKPAGEGRWFLELGLEREPSQAILDKLTGKQI